MAYFVLFSFSNLDLSNDQQIDGIIVILTYFSNITTKEDNQEKQWYNRV